MIINPGPFTPADLILNADGSIFHLHAFPGELSNDIIIVGDPGRVSTLSSKVFSKIETKRYFRGLRTYSGVMDLSYATGYDKLTGNLATIIGAKKKKQKLTLATSGMGTPCIEIVLGELVLLNEINFKKMTRKGPPYEMLNVIRVGTSGALQETTPLGTAIITKYALGLDNTGIFYDIGYPDFYQNSARNCKKLEDTVRRALEGEIDIDSRFKNSIRPYASMAHPSVMYALLDSSKLIDIDSKVGITASNSGFFANQGRGVFRIRPTVKDIDRIIAGIDPRIEGLMFENMEMEASHMLHFLSGGAEKTGTDGLYAAGSGQGYRSGAVCIAIANRFANTYIGDYSKQIKDATKVALLALYMLRHGPYKQDYVIQKAA